MSRLTANTTPAERARGCIFSENFENSQKVVENGGTLTNNAYVDSEHRLVLDGTSDWVQYSNLLNVGTEDFTIIAKIKSDSSPTDPYPRIISNRNSAGSLGITMYINTDDGNSIAVGIADGTNGWFSSGGTDLFDDTWHTVAVTCDRSGNATYYVDGAADGSADNISARSGNTDTANAPRIGAEADDGSTDFQGQIDYVKVFRGVVLTAQEILDYYNNSTYNYWNKAHALYLMRMEDHDATNGLTLDSSGNGYHATVSGFTKREGGIGYTNDGTSGRYIEPPNAAINVQNEGTVVSYIKFIDGTGSTRTFGTVTTGNGDWRSFEDGSAFRMIAGINGSTQNVYYTVAGDLGTEIYGLDHVFSIDWKYDGSTNTVFNGYHDGIRSSADLSSAGQTDLPPDGTFNLASWNRSNGLNGTIYATGIWPFQLTPLQHIDAMLRFKALRNTI